MVGLPHRRNSTEDGPPGFKPSDFAGMDLISGGLPCPPFSVAGKQLGKKDERNLFPAMIDLVDRFRPQALVSENVRAEKPDFSVDFSGRPP